MKSLNISSGRHERAALTSCVIRRSIRGHGRLSFPPTPRSSSALASSLHDLTSDNPIQSPQPSLPDPKLINDDNRPCNQTDRTWTLTDFFAFWVAMTVCIPTWHLACGLITQGFSIAQALGIVLLGTTITLIPMLASASAGTKYGLPFPVLARVAFGINGSHIPSLSRAVVACGWYGISTWIGSECLHRLVDLVAPIISLDLAWNAWTSTRISLLGISLSQAASFLSFWIIQVTAVGFGMDFIKAIEKGSAPMLVGLSLALLLWSLNASNGNLGPGFSSPSQFIPGGEREGQLLSALFPAVTAIVAFWGTLALNISDFSRFAVSQRSQAMGQALALPLSMVGFALLALTVSSTTVLIFGGAMITDPVAIVGRMQGPVAGLALLGLLLATLSTNVAANVVGPANAIANLSPQQIGFHAGALITASIGAAIQPWRLVGSERFFNFLLSYSVLLGPVLGIVVTDYWIVRKCIIDVNSLYKSGPQSIYWYSNGFNVAAVIAILVGIAPTLPGCLASLGLISSSSGFLHFLFEISFFVGAIVSSLIYWMLMSHLKHHKADHGP